MQNVFWINVLVAWWLCGAVGYWRALRVFGPIITRTDAFVICLAGLFGPLAWLYYLRALIDRPHGGCSKPVKWLSGKAHV